MLRTAAASFALTVIFAVTAAAPGLALEAPPLEPDALGFERTPPRLAFVDGEVSLRRPGADDDETPARVNMPLATGDELATGESANLELQIGPRAYLRAAGHSELALESLEPDFLQFRLTRGTAALDVRSIRTGHTLEIDTPNAAFTIERAGYYRIEVDESQTRFSSRRGGHATATPARGEPVAIEPNEQLVVTGVDDATLATYPAPGIDEWDRWNYARTAEKQEAESARYVPDDVYGVDELDRHGSWRVVATYGSVWVPNVAIGWSPYSSGIWAWDAYYGYSWVDDAPWGWAPFHYGRWVRVDGLWAWCPGPRVVRAYYAPALVAFYGTHGFSVSVGFGSSYIGWVPLGWGEPLVPWWGPYGCRGNVRWAGWGGPRIINNVEIHRHTVVHVANVKHYSHGPHASYMRGHRRILGVDREHFGRKSLRPQQLAERDVEKLRPLRDGDLGVAPAPDRVAGAERRGKLARPAVGDRKKISNAGRSADRSAARLAAVPRSERPRLEQRQQLDRRGQLEQREQKRVEQADRAAPPTPPRLDRMQREVRRDAKPERRNAVSERREHEVSRPEPPASFQERRASRQERNANRPDRADRNMNRESAPRFERQARPEQPARPERNARPERAERRDQVAPQPPRQRSIERSEPRGHGPQTSPQTSPRTSTGKREQKQQASPQSRSGRGEPGGTGGGLRGLQRGGLDRRG